MSRRLTAAERACLTPVLEETEITIRVVEEIEAVDDVLWLSGEAVGWLPGRRRIELSERSIEHLSDEQLLGLAAHELGHHRGRHVLVSKLLKAIVVIATLTAFLAGFVWWLVTTQLAWLAVSIAAVTGAVLVSLFAIPALSRRLELDADRRGAALIGRTEPLEALCDPTTEHASGLRDRLADLCFPWPRDEDRLRSLEKMQLD